MLEEILWKQGCIYVGSVPLGHIRQKRKGSLRLNSDYFNSNSQSNLTIYCPESPLSSFSPGKGYKPTQTFQDGYKTHNHGTFMLSDDI